MSAMYRSGLPFAAEMAAWTVVRVLWLGQSNALGQLDAYTTIGRWAGPHANPSVLAYKDTKIYASHVVDSWGALRENQPSGYGWEGGDLVLCASLFRDHNIAPELIMVAEGSTSIAVEWLPPAGALYARLVASYAAAVAAHPSPPASYDPWVVWIQGESDAADASRAAAYEANLAALIAAVRADLAGYVNSKWVLAMLHEDCAIAGSTPETVAQVRTAQAAVAAADPTRVFTADPSPYSLQGDFVHYTEATAIAFFRDVVAPIIGANT